MLITSIFQKKLVNQCVECSNNNPFQYRWRVIEKMKVNN